MNEGITHLFDVLTYAESRGGFLNTKPQAECLNIFPRGRANVNEMEQIYKVADFAFCMIPFTNSHRKVQKSCTLYILTVFAEICNLELQQNLGRSFI